MNSNNKSLVILWPCQASKVVFPESILYFDPFCNHSLTAVKIAPCINWSLIICMCSGQEAIRFLFLCSEWILGAKTKTIFHA